MVWGQSLAEATQALSPDVGHLTCDEFVQVVEIAKSSHINFADRDLHLVFDDFVTELKDLFVETVYADMAARSDLNPTTKKPVTIHVSTRNFADICSRSASMFDEMERASQFDLTSEERSRMWTLWPEIMTKSFLHALDPHSYFVGGRQVAAKMRARSGRAGVLAMNTVVIKDRLVVVAVNPRGPAYAAGVRKGYRWLKINGLKLSTECQLQCLYNLVEKAGATFSAEFETPVGVTQQLVLTKVPMTNKDYGIWSEQAAGERRAWVRLDSFYQGSGDDLVQVLADLELSTDALVLDLTSNFGGQEADMVKVLKAFLGSGVYGRSMDRRGSKIDFSVPGDDPPVYTKPVVVLVDRRTVSSAEFVAGVLQAYHRALIVGSNGATATYGKGNSYVWHYVVRTKDGLTLTYDTNPEAGREVVGEVGVTTRVSYLPNGRPTQSVGVFPDFILPALDLDPFHDGEHAQRERDMKNAITPPPVTSEFFDAALMRRRLQMPPKEEVLKRLKAPPRESFEAQANWLLEMAGIYAELIQEQR